MKYLLPLLFTLFLSGCVMYPLQIQLRGQKTLNPDEHHRSLPVVVHVYELSDSDPFLHASFQELWLQAPTVLQETLLKHYQVYVNPGSGKLLKFQRHLEANNICAIAIFRKPLLKKWRACKRLPATVPLVPLTVKFRLIDNRIEVT